LQPAPLERAVAEVGDDRRHAARTDRAIRSGDGAGRRPNRGTPFLLVDGEGVGRAHTRFYSRRDRVFVPRLGVSSVATASRSRAEL
jgi:hypothetical protein